MQGYIRGMRVYPGYTGIRGARVYTGYAGISGVHGYFMFGILVVKYKSVVLVSGEGYRGTIGYYDVTYHATMMSLTPLLYIH